MGFRPGREQIHEKRGPCRRAGGDLMVTQDQFAGPQSGPLVAPLTLHELREGTCAPHGAAR